jgi:formamidopyrimidine-DNA glycosylase
MIRRAVAILRVRPGQWCTARPISSNVPAAHRPASSASPEVVLPEGHTIHRLARDLDQLFTGSVVRAGTLQDRFATGAATLDGGTVVGTDAWGKHLFVAVAPARRLPSARPLWLHVHLGLYGRFGIGSGEPPAPQGALRLRLASERGWADLRGAIACELLDDDQRAGLIARLGADPLQKKADPLRPWARISRSRVGIGALLMQQDVLAGVGNVYRAEILFRQGIGPYRPGRSLTQEQWLQLWDDLRGLMRAGVRAGRIVTTRPADRPRGSRGPVRREDSFYVYRRAGEPCRLCAEPVRIELLAGRNLYWCGTEQPD